MTAVALLLAATVGVASPSPAPHGTIRGIVVNASRDQLPVGGSQVYLRVQTGGRLLPVAETTADGQGRFRFDHLPVDVDGPYLPGANRDGVHYPGPRIPLTGDRPHARVKLLVCDTTTGPSPLVITDYRVAIETRPGVVTVTESMSIENLSSLCYVGTSPASGAEPVTLHLAIPADFERATFHKEFFGRQFSIVDGKLVTGIPWPPGRRELAFTYVLACNEGGYVWRRPLDLPCHALRLAVRAGDIGHVSANLATTAADRPGETCFAATGTQLATGHVIQVTLGRLPIPAMVYGPPIAVIALVGLVATAAVHLLRRSRREPQS